MLLKSLFHMYDLLVNIVERSRANGGTVLPEDTFDYL
jgi:hypothetical protein